MTPAPSPHWLGWRLVRFRPGRYLDVTVRWTAFTLMPLATGLILQQLFDELSGSGAVDTRRALWLCAALAGVEAARGAVLWSVVRRWGHWLRSLETLLQTNVLRSLIGAGRGRGPSAGRLPGSPGDAVGRCRDDARNLVMMVDNWIDVASGTIFALVAFGVMLGIDPVLAFAVMLPTVLLVVVSRRLGPLLERWHREARRHGSRVTAFIGDVFANVVTLKGSGAERAATARLRRLNRQRRTAEVRDRLGRDLLATAATATGELGIGLVLLLAAPALRSGDFTVGELALFATYAAWLALFPEFVAELHYRSRQGRVAGERLTRLLAAHEGPADLVRHRSIWVGHPGAADGRDASADRRGVPVDGRGVSADRGDASADGQRFRELRAVGLTARHQRSRAGIDDVDLTIPRGSFTVVTGAVGSGKSTLLRALLGLLPIESGRLCWNDRAVDEPERFMLPPRVAYVGQVPRVFSDTLAENVVLGWAHQAEPDGDVTRALRLAVFDRDVDEMPDGLGTVIGARGTRLSGGQLQRALVRRPELLVVDDLSSALDVETEARLWRRLAAARADGTGPASLLVVSHRPAALREADQVVVLERGRVVASGSLDRLLEESVEMRRLWVADHLTESLL